MTTFGGLLFHDLFGFSYLLAHRLGSIPVFVEFPFRVSYCLLVKIKVIPPFSPSPNLKNL